MRGNLVPKLCLHLAFRSLFSINKAPNDEPQGSKLRELSLSQTTVNLERLERLHTEHHLLKKAVLSLIRILMGSFLMPVVTLCPIYMADFLTVAIVMRSVV